ncbi:hypothetical protein J3458_005054 [Metarhizium acridum]|uniref:uncharacterized protein n=1 Tax=Metarhizium acridum TaxID=92637 RepID=UPI001C6B0AE5|nr:hypothetical protein J3458_005054 [Metarhizium acridum]
MASRNPFENNDHRDPDAHAPEAVDMLSPMTPLSNLESELQTKYQSARSSERQPPPQRPADSEKEVVSLEHDSALKHVVPLELTSEYPETATVVTPPTPRTMDADTLKVRSMSDAAPEALPPGGEGGGANKDQRILGMSRKAFLILIAVVIIIVAAAVGGGVGGAVASTKKSDATPATSSSSSSTPTSSTATTSGAAPSQTVQFLNNQTWPQGYDFAFQGYSRPNFTGAATQILTGDGGANTGRDFDFDVHSYIWVPNIGNCCVNFCANSTKQGYIGYKCTPLRKNESSEAVARAFVWCDNTHSDAIAESKGCS